MALAMLASAEMIMGKLSSVFGISLNEGDSTENLRNKLDEVVKATKEAEGTLILVDLPGATPFNVSATFAHQKEDVAVVSGLNLPMLLEVVINNQHSSLKELETIAKDSGKAGILTFSEIMAE
jgi:PTS system mannose-specific IIA component/PTS system mannose-specific IIB component